MPASETLTPPTPKLKPKNKLPKLILHFLECDYCPPEHRHLVFTRLIDTGGMRRRRLWLATECLDCADAIGATKVTCMVNPHA